MIFTVSPPVATFNIFMLVIVTVTVMVMVMAMVILRIS